MVLTSPLTTRASLVAYLPGRLKIVLLLVRRHQRFVQHTSLHFGWYWHTQQGQNRGRDVKVVTRGDLFTRPNSGSVEQHHARWIMATGLNLSCVVDQIPIPKNLTTFTSREVAARVFGILVIVAQG